MPNHLIHVAKIFDSALGWTWLFLRHTGENEFVWFQQSGDAEQITGMRGSNAENAIFLARRHWKEHFFTTLKCGFRFTLPERDEIGSNALFCHMYASYAVMNGVYYDEELGHPCVVRDASNQALDLMKTLQLQGRT